MSPTIGIPVLSRTFTAPTLLSGASCETGRGLLSYHGFTPNYAPLEQDNGLVLWPCESMGLWPSMVLLLDTQERLLIWTGASAAQELSSNPEGRLLLVLVSAY